MLYNCIHHVKNVLKNIYMITQESIDFVHFSHLLFNGTTWTRPCWGEQVVAPFSCVARLFGTQRCCDIQTLSESLIRFMTQVGLCSGCERGMRSSVVTTARPFHLSRSIHHAVPRNSALQMSCCLHHAHTLFWSGVPNHRVNAQGVWLCKLLIDSLPLQLVTMSPDLMSTCANSPVDTFQRQLQSNPQLETSRVSFRCDEK